MSEYLSLIPDCSDSGFQPLQTQRGSHDGSSRRVLAIHIGGLDGAHSFVHAIVGISVVNKQMREFSRSLPLLTSLILTVSLPLELTK